MKLSRKALVAVATTAALTVGGLSAPANAGTTATTTPAASSLMNLSSDDSATEPDKGSSNEEGEKGGILDGSSDKDGNLMPDQLKNWIGVFTAVVGALSAIFVFIQRLNG